METVSRSRRRTELIMLVFAFALVLFALANVGFTLHGKLPSGAGLYLAVYMAIVVLAHLAMRRFAPWADPLLLPLAALLNGLSIVMMFRLSAQVNPATGIPRSALRRPTCRSPSRPSVSAASSRCSS